MKTSGIAFGFGLCCGFIFFPAGSALAADTGLFQRADTVAAQPPKKSPDSVPFAPPKRRAADVWREIDDAMTRLGRSVETRKYEAMRPDAEKIRDGIRWTVDHPLSSDRTYVGSIGGTGELIRQFVEILVKGAEIKNWANVDFSYKKLAQLIETQRNTYHNPPAPPEPVNAPPAAPDTPAAKSKPQPNPSKKK